MRNHDRIGTQLGYTSTEELRQKYNGILTLSTKELLYEVASRFLNEGTIFHVVNYSNDLSKVTIKF